MPVQHRCRNPLFVVPESLVDIQSAIPTAQDLTVGCLATVLLVEVGSKRMIDELWQRLRDQNLAPRRDDRAGGKVGQDLRCVGIRAKDYVFGRDRLVTDANAGHPIAIPLQTSYSGPQPELGPQFASSIRKAVHKAERPEMSRIVGELGADDRWPEGRLETACLIDIQHFGPNACRRLGMGTFRDVSKLRFSCGNVEGTGQPEFEIDIEFLRQLLHEVEICIRDQVHGIAGTGMHGRSDTGHPAVATGCARTNASLIDDQHLATALGKAIRRRTTHDTGTNNNHIRALHRRELLNN